MRGKRGALADDLRWAADRAKLARREATTIDGRRVKDMRLAECEALLRLLAILIDDYGPERTPEGKFK